MIERAPYIPTEFQLNMARRATPLKAAEMMEPTTRHPLDTFGLLHLYRQRWLLSAVRIHGNAERQLAERSQNLQVAGTHLDAQRNTIVTVYRNDRVQNALRETQGLTKPFDYQTAMGLDEVRYTTTLAALTGNPQLLDNAIFQMYRIIDSASDQTARKLARFEQQRLIYQREPTREYFRRVTQLYDKVVTTLSDEKRFPEIVTLCARYSVNAIEQSERMHGISVAKNYGEQTKIGMAFRREIKKREIQEQWAKQPPKLRGEYNSLILPPIER